MKKSTNNNKKSYYFSVKTIKKVANFSVKKERR